MNIVARTAVLIACGCLILLTRASLGGNMPDSSPAVLEKLLKAVQENDYAAFVADGTAEFKAGLTPHMLEGVSAQLAFRMNRGYEAKYLGQLAQQGSQVHLWKLVFKDGQDDVLAKLVLINDKVAGFWLQ